MAQDHHTTSLGLQDVGASRWAPDLAGSRGLLGGCTPAGGWASLTLSVQGTQGSRRCCREAGCVSPCLSVRLCVSASLPAPVSASARPSLSLPLPASSLPPTQASPWAARRWQQQLNGPLVPGPHPPLGVTPGQALAACCLKGLVPTEKGREGAASPPEPHPCQRWGMDGGGGLPSPDTPKLPGGQTEGRETRWGWGDPLGTETVHAG